MFLFIIVMERKNMERRFKLKILFLIPLFLFVATEGIFSVQSLLPLIVVTFVYDCLFSNHRIDKTEGYVYIIFLLITILSIATNIIFSPNYLTNQSFIRIIYQIIIIYFYYSMTHVKYSSDDINLALYSLIGVGCIVSLYFVFIQKIWFVNFLGVRIDKNFVGAFLMLGANFSFIFLLKNKKRKKIMFCAAYILLLIGIFFSASRASMLYCIATNFITLIMYVKQISKSSKGFLKALIIICCLPIALIVFWNLIQSKMSNSSIDISWYWNRYFVNGYSDISVTGRFVWWKKAFEYFMKRPLYGYGIGSINVSGNSSAVTHNTYLDFLVDQGILGFLLFLFLLKRSLCKIFYYKQELFYGVVLCVLIGIFNLSATRSTFLWYSLILLYSISRCDWKGQNEYFKTE